MSRWSSVRLVAVIALGCCLATACTSSAAPKHTNAPSGSDVPDTGSASTSASSTPTSVATGAPLSAFETDPSVQAMRKWTAEGGRTVNTGHYDSAALDALMTPLAKSRIKPVFGPDVGGYYPGPLPFQPISISAPSPTQRNILGCAELNGWVQDPKTRKPQHKYQVAGTEFFMVEKAGTWLVNAFYSNPGIPCANVKVKAPRW